VVPAPGRAGKPQERCGGHGQDERRPRSHGKRPVSGILQGQVQGAKHAEEYRSGEQVVPRLEPREHEEVQRREILEHRVQKLGGVEDWLIEEGLGQNPVLDTASGSYPVDE
jgi:hypothetical protein